MCAVDPSAPVKHTVAQSRSDISPRAAETAQVNRRGTFGLAAGVAVALASVGCASADRPVRLGSAQPGGQFHHFASALAVAAASHTRIRIEPVITQGSVTNLRLLAHGAIDAALVLGDSIPESTRALAIGRVHECYIQVAVRPDSPISRLGDLRGRRIDLGLLGSGSARTGVRLLRTSGLRPGIDVTVEHRALAAALRALHNREVDAILWGDEVPTPAFGLPMRLRLLDLAEWVIPMHRRFGYPYDQVSVPMNTYSGSTAVDTVGVPTLLLTSPHLANPTVTAIAELLLNRGDKLVPTHTMSFQFLDRRWLVGTGHVPLHPAAAAYYRTGHG
ncbi:TAXI family TRAP transporter solute-binding subunit [Nocardia carnea]|uniref:TAXI family TRAP transporter solute-binding subunit n=1 Tax=Nocardia carnea TaxID=37328 RepID=UPI0024537B0B|nr:TAXI family TRAP transporter solute-binding subunit [Nocardia carnea]